MRRHMDASHRVGSVNSRLRLMYSWLDLLQDEYLKWADANKFVSMLPKDTKRRKLEAAASANSQSRLDVHLREQKLEERIIPYSDSLFQEAAIEWLIETDQVHYLLS